MGNKTKDFTFTFTKTGAAVTDEFTWSKNGVEQTTKLHSGGTFTMSHNDEVVITVPKDAVVTITEANEGYNTTFKLGDATAEEVTTKPSLYPTTLPPRRHQLLKCRYPDRRLDVIWYVAPSGRSVSDRNFFV